MPTALIYVRKSVVKSNKPTLSPQRQEEACQEFCKGKDWVVEVYADAEGHRSGRSEKKRPEWLRLKERLTYAQAGEIAAVVVYSLDRSSRSTRDFLNFLHLLQEKKADFVSVTQPFLDTTSAVGRAFMSMISIWSQLEADMDSERVTADIAFRQEQGIHFGHCPIGYTRQTVGGERIPVPDAVASKIVQIWERYAEGGDSYRSLARWINTVLQLPTKNGDTWTHKHVQIMFDNHLFYRGWVTRHRKRGGQEKYQGKHQGIVSDELAEKVLRVRTEKEDTKLRYGRPPKQEYLLSSLLYCAGCGQKLRGQPSHGKQVYQHVGRSPCNWSLAPAATIERAVLDTFRGWEPPSGIEFDLEHDIVEDIRHHRLQDTDAKKLRQLETRKEKALRLFEMGMRDEPWLMATVAEIDAAIKELSPPVSLPYNPRKMVELTRLFGVFLSDPNTPRDTIKSLLHMILERIEIESGTVVRLQPRPWFLQFFRDCARVADGNQVVPPRERGSDFTAFKQGIDGILALSR